jgi:phosphoglycolate phosphatase
MNIELIIFDLDGTLAQSHFDLCDAANQVLAHYGRPLLSYEAVQPLLGSGLNALLQEALQTKDPKQLAEAHKIFHDFYRKHYANKTIPYPGVKSTLAKLNGVKKAVFSNKSHPYTVGMIQKLGLEEYFERVVGTSPDGITHKPDPQGIFYILNELNIRPENTLMVGDSTHDIEAGKAAGTFTCAVSYGYRPLSLLLKMEPDLTVDSFGELADRF